MRTPTLLLALGAVVFIGACERKSAVVPTPVCSFTIDTANRAFPSDGGSGTLAVTASEASCAWTTTSNASWVTVVSGQSGTGSGSVQYTVAAHTGDDTRTATVTAAGITHTITEQGKSSTSCTFALSPSSASVASAGGVGSFDVTAPAGCVWTTRIVDAWITITGADSGTGSGRIDYRAEANSGLAREGTIVAGGQNFVLTQPGLVQTSCDVLLTPTSFDVCLSKGTVVSQVSAASSCSWTATSDASWLTVQSGTGTGAQDITAEHGFNYDAPREGTVTVRGGTGGLVQTFKVSQAGCRYTVSQSTFAIPVGGGSGTFGVTQVTEPIACGGPLMNRCEWTPTTDVAWITITNPAQRTGDDPVDFTVAANATGAARTGTITVRDKTVQVNQSAQ